MPLEDAKSGMLKWVALGAMSALALGVPYSALAQGGGQASGGSAASGQVGFERRPQLSLQDELAQVEMIISRIDQAGGTVRRQLDTARQGRDVVKSLCLSDKLSQIDVAGRSARERQAALQSAAQRNDSELSNHEFAILTVLRQRTEQLGAEANQCIGEEVAFVGQTLVLMTTEPNTPSTEETTFFPPLLVPPPPIVPTPPPVMGPPMQASSTH
jgi:hypothetical protein